MKKGQTSVRNGVQDLLCPFDKLYITQGSNGGYSHKGSTAIDTTSGTVGEKRAYYAPCDLKCVAVDKNYAFVWWQSINKVRFANGKIAYATIMVGHDETINATIGMTVKQGVQLGNLGAGGKATGVHCHIEVSPTHEKTWIPNKYGVYILPNQIEFEDAFFMDNTEIKLGVAPWKYLKDVAVVVNQKPTSVKPTKPTVKAPDQVLEIGSKVKFASKLRVEKYKNETVYNSRIGIWLPTSIMTEDSANDGKLDQYFANTNATFTIAGTYTVDGLKQSGCVWWAHLKELGVWVKAEPLIEVVDA